MLTIHVVSHTHWDREWYLTFQQFRFRLVELMDQLLALLAADPEYRYFMLDGQAVVLEDYLEIRPEREEELRRYVHEGRLLIGPWYVLPDEFLVSPEALVRNLLWGERVCRRFGPRMSIGYLPDPFGHVGQMPQILRGFGMDAACLWRGVGDRPAELRWRAPDSSEVLLLHLRDSYSNAAWLSADEDGFVQGLVELRDSLAPHTATSHILAMQGTDHMRPRADLPRLLTAAAARLDDTRVVHSTLPRYLAAVREELGTRESELPVIVGELRSPARTHLLPGVLSTRMWVKQRNHACETLLEKWAEPFGTFGTLVTGTLVHWETGNTSETGPPTYQSTRNLIQRAWKYLLENHPHDSICGCSIDQVHREMVTRFDWCEQIGEEVTQRALGEIARAINTPTPAVVVFNPLSSPRTDLVTADVEPPPDPGSVLVDDAGQPVVYRVLGRRTRDFFGLEVYRDSFAVLLAQFRAAGGQVQERFTFRRAEVTVEGNTAHVYIVVSQQEGAEPGPLDEALAQAEALLADGSIQRYRVRVLDEEALTVQFTARDLPSLGYRTYHFEPGSRQSSAVSVEHPAFSIENEFFHVEADPASGTLTVTDKTTGQVLRGCNRFVDGGDRGDEYNYCAPEHDQLVDQPAVAPKLKRLSADEVGATLEVKVTYRVPVSLVSDDRACRAPETVELPIVTRVTLAAGVPRIDLQTRVDNRARDHRLRVHFPVPRRVDTAWTEGHWDVVERLLDLPTDTEGWPEKPVPTQPQRGFVDVGGVMLANRGLPEVEVLRTEGGAEIALTLLRCVGWLSRGDMRCRQSHAGPEEAVSEAQCPGEHTFHYSLIPHAGDWRRGFAQAHAFAVPLRATSTRAHEGALPSRLSFVELEPATLVLSAVKEPEESAPPLVGEVEGGEGLIVRCWNADREPVEGTIRLWRPFRQALRVNLAEEGDTELAHDADAVSLAVRGREVVTLRFDF